MGNGVQLAIVHPADGDQRLDRVRAAVGAVVNTDDKVEGLYTIVPGLIYGVAFKDPVGGVAEYATVDGDDAADVGAGIVAAVTALGVSGITATDLTGGSIRIAIAGSVKMGLWFYARYPGTQFREYEGAAPFAVTSNAYYAVAGSLVKAMSTAAGTTAANVAAFFGTQENTTHPGLQGQINPTQWFNPASGIFEIGSVPGNAPYAFTCSVGGGNLAITKSATILNGANINKQGVCYLGDTVRRVGLYLQNKHASIVAYQRYDGAASSSHREIAAKASAVWGEGFHARVHVYLSDPGVPAAFFAEAYV